MRMLDVTVKDLSQLFRDKRPAAFLLGAPILFTILMGIMMGGLGGSEEEDPRLAVAVWDRDGGVLAESLVGLLESAESVRPVEAEEQEDESLRQQVGKGKYAAAVVIPEGYTQALLAGEESGLQIMVDETVDAGAHAEPAIRAAIFRLLTAVQAARWSADLAAQQKPFVDSAERESFIEQALRDAVGEWEEAPVTLQLRSAAVDSSDEPSYPMGFAQASPGNMVTFALAGLIGAAEIIVWERKSGTLQRLLTTSISRAEILIGHFLAMFALVFLQVIILGTFGQLLFGLPYWNEGAAFLVVAAAVTFWIASMGLLIGVLARTSDQVAMFSIVPMLLLAGLGGAWMPLEVTGETFQAVGHLTPTYWAMQGMQNLILRGQGFAGIALPAAVLCGFGLLFFGIALLQFHRE
jgi:ABC-2 type transport system permease protein